MDFGSRGIKSVESMLVGLDHEHLLLRLLLHLNGVWASSESFQDFDWIPLGDNGEAGVHVAAREFRLRTKITNYLNSRLDYLTPNVKYSDQRFKRGLSPTQANRGVEG